MPTLPKAPDRLFDPIWEIQPNEAKTHYHWFQAFMALRPYERRLQAAWELVMNGTSKEGTRYSNYFRQVSQHWRWTERAIAKDLADMQSTEAVWIERDKKRREDAYEVGEKLVDQAKRVLKKIEQLPDHDLKASLSEAKDVAVAGTQLQEAAIPSMQLAVDQMQWLLASLPNEKRVIVLQKLKEAKESPRGLLMSDSQIDEGDFAEINDDEEEDAAE